MPRTISLALALELASQESGVPLIPLLAITHLQLPSAIYLCRNGKSITSTAYDGSTPQTYLPFPFDLKLPIDSALQLPQAQLVMDAIDRTIIEAIRSISTYPSCKVMLVLSSQPNISDISLSFDMRAAQYDAYTVSFDLTNEPILNEPHPADSVTPQTLPGLFS